MDRRPASPQLLPGFNGRERQSDEAGGLVGGDAEQPQLGLGELIDGGLVDAFGVPSWPDASPC